MILENGLIENLNYCVMDIYGIIYLLVNEIFHVALRRGVNGKSKYRPKRICGV